MRIRSFSVSRYRSIVEARHIELSDYTTLIGKNNEGKTNFLSAMHSAFSMLKAPSNGARNTILDRVNPSRGIYDWDRDFPLQLRDPKLRKQESVFRVTFELADADVLAIKKSTSITFSDALTVEISVGANNTPKFDIRIQGPSAQKIKNKAAEIFKIISTRMSVTYIPAIRTEESVLEVISGLVSHALYKVEKDSAYRNAIEQIRKLQEPVLKKISEEITRTLRQFIPNVNEVTIDTSAGRIIRAASRNIEMIVDDGSPTPLEMKGDGIKSLVALSLSQSTRFPGTSHMLLIEEPESHLHPGAAHELREIIFGLSAESQVVISSHNPIFVNRTRIRGNILVEQGRATPAKDLRQIRECLGVRVSDNLRHADLVVIVEGSTDETVLRKVLPILKPEYSSMLKNGIVTFEVAGGAPNLSHRLALVKQSLCKFFVAFDNDVEGKRAVKEPLREGILLDTEYTLFAVSGRRESEIEDCINPVVYQQTIEKRFGISIPPGAFEKSEKKWKDTLVDILTVQGKIAGKKQIDDAKIGVAEAVAASADDVLTPGGRIILHQIAENILSRLTA